MPSETINLTLISNVGGLYAKDNKASCFKTKLAQPLVLDGDWRVALIDIQYSHNWWNVTEATTMSLLRVIGSEERAAANPTLRQLRREEALKASAEYKKVEVPTQYYGSPDELVRYVCRKLNDLAMSDWPRLLPSYDPITGIAKIEMQQEEDPEKQFYLVASSNTTMAMMGFSVDKEPIGYEDYAANFYKLPLEASQAARLPSMQTMMVYCDIIGYELVGNQRAQLLGSLPFAGDPGKEQSWVFDHPVLHKVTKSHIGEVEVKITNEQGDLFPFVDGIVSCRFLFKRK